ncbi:transporter substrate-binding domain-containing protein [Pseudomonas sp. LjRoot71]|uniref:substrate-binding periplasmic protein n=1 Tax=Pseudomonas sp. LjRoot71 TaxID=3342336 RepID=UPI003ECF5D46
MLALHRTRYRAPCLTHMGCGLISVLLTLISPLAGADQTPPLRVCISDVDVPPFTYREKTGTAHQLALDAALLLGWPIRVERLPWKRCWNGTAQGHFDAIAVITRSTTNLAHFAFPQDNSGAVGLARMVFIRQRGSPVTWDGEHIHGLSGPVLYMTGVTLLENHFRTRQISAEDSPQTIEAMLRMLLKGRGNLAADSESRLLHAINQPEFQGRFEILPLPIIEEPLYLAINPTFHSNHKQRVEQLWDEIARQKAVTANPSNLPEVP